MYLFFDTETTGVPKNYKGDVRDLNNWPRVIQLAWALYDKDGTLLKEKVSLIHPDGWEVPKEKFWIDNGFTTEENRRLGSPILHQLNHFRNQINECEYIIAHNMAFDYPIIASEMIRANVKANKRPMKFCTMEASTDICKIPGQYGKFKWPKLEELHQFLFQEGFDGAHDAMNDVKACAKCFFEMKDRSLIDLTLLSL